jgi:probable phosphoglycerate mutase
VTSKSGDIWLVRHGATEWTASYRHTGRTDLDLNDEGRAQAAALCRPLAAVQFTAAYTSPLVRARETARIAGFADAEVLDDLMEWNYGAAEGRTTAEIRETDPDWSVWSRPLEGAETLDEVATRARRVLDVVARREGRVLLFAHGHLLRVLTACALGLDPIAAKVLALDAGSVSVIGFEHDYRALRGWNRRP